MLETLTTIEVPLVHDEHGIIRVRGTRVLLELVIHAFWQGETPESIVDSYSTLKLGDVYAVIAYYLAHRDEIDAYVRDADEKTERIRQEVEANNTPETHTLLKRLRAKRDKRRHSNS
jgi:uncharacterized protein (DUF433 family)